MTVSAAPVTGRNFRLAMCQIAQPGDGTDKSANLAHARDLVAEAVRGDSEGRKPDLVILPVRETSDTVTHRGLARADPNRVGVWPIPFIGDLQLSLRDGDVQEICRNDRLDRGGELELFRRTDCKRKCQDVERDRERAQYLADRRQGTSYPLGPRSRG